MIENTSSNAPESDSGGFGIPSEKRCAAVRFREASAREAALRLMSKTRHESETSSIPCKTKFIGV
jgi:hypothetical protein